MGRHPDLPSPTLATARRDSRRDAGRKRAAVLRLSPAVVLDHTNTAAKRTRDRKEPRRALLRFSRSSAGRSVAAGLGRSGPRDPANVLRQAPPEQPQTLNRREFTG